MPPVKKRPARKPEPKRDRRGRKPSRPTSEQRAAQPSRQDRTAETQRHQKKQSWLRGAQAKHVAAREAKLGHLQTQSNKLEHEAKHHIAEITHLRDTCAELREAASSAQSRLTELSLENTALRERSEALSKENLELRTSNTSLSCLLRVAGGLPAKRDVEDKVADVEPGVPAHWTRAERNLLADDRQNKRSRIGWGPGA